MKKFIYCETHDKDRLLKEGLNFICNQKLGDKEYCVFENKKIETLRFDCSNLIVTDKMFF